MKWFALFLLLVSAAEAQEPAAELRRWLDARAETLFAERTKHESSLRNPADVLKWQREARLRFENVLGAMPSEKSPLHPQVTGRLERDGYRIENVRFESLPGFLVTANLYIPTSSAGPHPAVLGVAGHSNNGKANDTYQHAWIGFVRRGYVVLAFDPVGQGERIQLWDKASKKAMAGVGVPEHNVVGMQLLLTGSTMAGIEVWDGIRAFDYLLTRPEVDPTRIAVAGNSGGGTQAAYLAVADPRLAAVVSSCYPTKWSDLWKSPGPQDAEQSLPGFLKQGLDFPDYPLALAPRPYLMTSAIRDYFPIAGARATFETVRTWYGLLDAMPKVGFFEYDDGHGWSLPRREAAYRFLDKWLRGVESDGKEGEIRVEPDSALQVTAAGQVMEEDGSRSIQQWNVDRAAMLGKQRPRPDRKTAVGLVQAGTSRPDAKLMSRVQGLEHWSVRIDGNLRLPVRVWGSTRGVKKAVLLAGIAEEKVLADELQNAGYLVVAWTPRGTGEWIETKGQLGYSGAYQVAAKAWLLGDSLPRMQAEDVVLVTRAVRAQAPGIEQMYLVAQGAAAPASLIGAAAADNIDGVLLASPIHSYEEIVRQKLPSELEMLAWPGILAKLDLPEAAALLHPTQVQWLEAGAGIREGIRDLIRRTEK